MKHRIACFRNNLKKLVESLPGKTYSSRDFSNNTHSNSGGYDWGSGHRDATRHDEHDRVDDGAYLCFCKPPRQ
jgi:hypothetical protein